MGLSASVTGTVDPYESAELLLESNPTFEDCDGGNIVVTSLGGEDILFTNIRSIITDPARTHGHLRLYGTNRSRFKGSLFYGGSTPPGGVYAITIDDGGVPNPSRATEFDDCTFNFVGGTAGGKTIRIQTTAQDTILGQNRYVDAILDFFDYTAVSTTRRLQTWLADNRQNVVLGTLPTNAVVTAVSVQVTEAFNSDGTDLIRVGYDADEDAFATDTDVSTTGIKTVVLGVLAGYNSTTRSVEAYYANGGSEPTTGKALVTLEYHLAGAAIA